MLPAISPYAQQLLDSGLSALPYSVSESERDKLCGYLQLLQKWNSTHNLSAVRDVVEQVQLHILDSLAVVPLVGESTTVADIGSGAGLPGIVLAIVRPNQKIKLVESSRKKSVFLRECSRVLALDNVEVIAMRSESWHPVEKLGWIISRAVADINKFIRVSAHLGDDTSVWGLMKAHDNEECSVSGFYKSRVLAVTVPFLDAPRLWVEVKRVSNQ